MSVGYHPENLKLQPYSHDAVKELAAHAARLGVQFKINGIPFGASYDRDMWNDFFENRDWPAASAGAIVLLVLLVGPIVWFERRQTKGEAA